MKYLSVCSGIEAATVAWHGLGWEPVAFAEIEAFPAAVLTNHYPTVPNLGDLTKYREWPEELLVEVDLLVGGTPCQAFSVAGLRRSLDDERGNLSLTYVNLFHHINEVRKRHGRSPAIALWENVPGCLSTKDNAFGCILGGLLGCDEAPATESGKWDKAGFLSSETVRVGYRVLDAQYFGVAQRRRRVFLAAVPCELVERFGERACPSEILSLRESVLGNPPTRGAAWEGVARATAAGTASGGRGVAGTLDSNYHKGCGERAGVEKEVVISRGIAVDTYNQTISDTSIPVRVGNAKDSLPAVIDAPPVCGTLSDGAHMGGGLTGRTHTRGESCPCVANPLTARMHKGINTTADEGQTPIVTQGGAFSRAAFGGNNRSGSIDVAASLLSHSGPHGRQDFTSETFLVEGHPDPAYAISAGQQGKGGVFVSGRDSQDTFVSVAFKPGQSEAVAIDLQNVAIGGDIAGTLDTTRPSRGGGQAVAFTKAKPAQSSEDDESWVPGEVAPTQNQFDQGDTRATTVVALRSGCHTQEDHALYTKGYYARQQNACSQEADSRKVLPLLREEVGEKDFAEWGLGILDSLQGEEVLRSGVLGEGDGAAEEVSDSEAGREVVGGSSQSKKHMPQGRVSKVRKAGRERRASQGWKLSKQLAGELGVYLQELSQQNSPAEEIVRDLRKASEGIRLLHDALPEVQDVGRSAGDEVEPVRSTSEMQRGHQAQPMCVRRLTATECEFLQGFPPDYTAVTYRKKPAADGPRYRALGNSMAVPCMWWLGKRIQMATGHAK